MSLPASHRSNHTLSEHPRGEHPRLSKSQQRARWILNGVIVFLFLSVVYFSYAFYTNHLSETSDARVEPLTPSGKPIQVDVLNGCGVSGIASKVSTFLRKGGFDVVEVRNYSSFDIRETLVIDRVGNLSQARRVALELGVDQHNIIQEINYDYYVDVSVVIGKDFASLRALQ